jgi:Cu(I)/Ag(I) efflux system membrane fusion protein
MNATPSPRALRIAALVRWVLVAAAVVLAVAGVAVGLGLLGGDFVARTFTCPMHPEVRAATPGSCPVCGMDLVETASAPGARPRDEARASVSAAAAPAAGDSDAVYTCPMHPEVVQRGPGRCPDCRMFLVPRAGATATADAGTDAGAPAAESRLAADATSDRQPTVYVRQSAARRLGIVAVPVTAREFAATVRVPGTVEFDADAVAVVDVRLPGWLTSLRVRGVGEPVRRGTPLGTLTSPALHEAEAQLAAAVAAAAVMGSGASLLASARARALAVGVPAAEVERIARGGTPTPTLTLRAPRGGVVVAVGASAGSYVAPGTPVVTIADPARLAVIAEVPERELEAFAPGTSVRVRPSRVSDAAPSDPDRSDVGRPAQDAEATVMWLAPIADPARRSVAARLRFSTPPAHAAATSMLRPGASVWVETTGPPRRALWVPRDAVLPGAGRATVFVDAGDDHYRPRDVRVGVDLGDVVEVLEGLREGDRVAARAAFLLEAESRLHGGAR